MSEKIAWVIGATGLVGRETVISLANEPSITKVVAFTRRPLDITHSKLETRILDFEHIEDELRGLSADVAACCLGTTIKVAGSQERFRHVDYDYPLAFARAAKSAGVRHLAVVTALGSSTRSMAFYSRVKGEVERDVAKLGLPAVSYLRPSLLLGERPEHRLGETLAAPFSKLLPLRYRGIEAKCVARAMTKLLTSEASGVRVVLSDELQKLGS